MKLEYWLQLAKKGQLPMGVAYNILVDWQNDREDLAKDVERLDLDLKAYKKALATAASRRDQLKTDLDSLFAHHVSTKNLIMKALIILHDKGGSLLSRPDEHRRWKINSDNCICSSVSLVRACKMLVDSEKELEEKTL